MCGTPAFINSNLLFPFGHLLLINLDKESDYLEY